MLLLREASASEQLGPALSRDKVIVFEVPSVVPGPAPPPPAAPGNLKKCIWSLVGDLLDQKSGAQRPMVNKPFRSSF